MQKRSSYLETPKTICDTLHTQCSAQVFKKGRVPSEKGTFSAVSGPSKGHNYRGELKKKGTISAVNGRNRVCGQQKGQNRAKSHV